MIQVFLFYITHITLSNLLQCFGVNTEEYHNLSLPEFCADSLKSYILTMSKAMSDDDQAEEQESATGESKETKSQDHTEDLP